MTRRLQRPSPIAAVGVLALSWSVLSAAVTASPPAPALPSAAGLAGPAVAREAWQVFSAKCAKCHGPASAGKKTKFHTILDLPTLASNRRLVVPSRPDDSKLWRAVRDDDMPPEDSGMGPLSAGEKQAVRTWIEAGTPTSSAAQPAAAGDREVEPLPMRAMHWVGRFHVVVIHFPIALLMAAALAEGWAMVRRRPAPAGIVRYCVALAAAGAVAAALLGWLRVSFNGYEPASVRMLNLHRWLGTAAGLLAIVAAALAVLPRNNTRHPLRFRLALFGSVLLVGAAAHLGGILVHGDDYFTW